jgi:hypothetical protein
MKKLFISGMYISSEINNAKIKRQEMQIVVINHNWFQQGIEHLMQLAVKNRPAISKNYLEYKGYWVIDLTPLPLSFAEERGCALTVLGQRTFKPSWL